MKNHIIVPTHDLSLIQGLVDCLKQYDPNPSVQGQHEGVGFAMKANTAFRAYQDNGGDAEIICFMHSDARLWFDYPKIMPIYFSELENPGILGFIGCNRPQCGDSRWWLQPGACFGSLVQGGHRPGGDQDVPFNLGFTPPSQCLLNRPELSFEPGIYGMDGYCIFVKASVFKKIGGFDQDTFTDFHGFDGDICRTAIKQGFVNYIIGQKTQHFSSGSLEGAWAAENAKFVKKWSGQ